MIYDRCTIKVTQILIFITRRSIMAAIALLNERIELNVTTEALKTFAEEIEVEVGELNDLELASAIINKIDSLDDVAWEAMTMALKEWSNTINNKKIEIAELEKKEAIAIKAQKTKWARVADAGIPVTPAAIKNAINACKTKAAIATQVASISRALGMDAAPVIAKSWTIAKQKEAAIAGLKKPKSAKPSGPVKTVKTVKTEKTEKISKSADSVRTKSPSASEVKAAKSNAAKTVVEKEKTKGGGIEDGEPFRKNTTAYMEWNVFKSSKAKSGVALEIIKGKFTAALEAAGKSSSNPDGRVIRVIAELKKKGFIQRLETGNYINSELVSG